MVCPCGTALDREEKLLDLCSHCSDPICDRCYELHHACPDHQREVSEMTAQAREMSRRERRELARARRAS
jgi:hypothetical protein